MKTAKADVEAVLAIGLAKSSSSRFSTGTELAAALAAGARGQLSESLRARAEEILAAKDWSSS